MGTGTAPRQTDYEYVVVGSGAGGGPLAANLAKAGHTVLLLEAGGDAEPLTYQVPLFHALSTEDESLRWDFFVKHYSTKEKQCRDKKFLEEKDGILYPRAGTLGGCTAHNAMITVYPHNSDWDYIADLMDDPSWSSDNMRKYFQKLENCRHRPIRRILHNLSGWNPTRHGFQGWLPSSAPDPRLLLNDKKLFRLLTGSALEALFGFRNPLRFIKRLLGTKLDPNDWRLVKKNAQVIGYVPLATDGRKRAGAREYIRQIQQQFPDRLSVMTHCLATRVLFDDDNRAIGVEYLHGENLYEASPVPVAQEEVGERHEVYVSREVILSGGAFNTPQLLKLSGIGPREELEEYGIPMRKELPGVGENLQDRYEIGVVYRMKDNFTLVNSNIEPPGPDEDPSGEFRMWQKGEGPYTTNGAVLAIIKRSEGRSQDEPPDLFIFALPGIFTGYYPGYSDPIRTERDYLTWVILKGHTNNRAGQVTLRSNDPRDVPEINFHYFDEGSEGFEEDLGSLVSGIKFVKRLMGDASEFIAEEVCPNPSVNSQERLEDFIKYQSWGHHGSCSCRIGPEGNMGVLNSKFRVYGTKNLRVVDASVFPRIPGLFVVSTVYMISEKASDVILADAAQQDV